MATLGYESSRGRYSPGLRWVAWLTAACMFALILMGGLVTSNQAGLAVPDWPNSFGYNMFTFPPSMWKGGIFYEHTHRLLGTLVGMLTIIQLIWVMNADKRIWTKLLATGVLTGVIIQGVLGGLRVVLVNLDLAIIHGCFAQAMFCLQILMCAACSRWWIETPDIPREQRVEHGLIGLAIFCVAAIYIQLIAGAVMRHNEAGLAIPDFPASYGQVLPPTDDSVLPQLNAARAAENLKPVTITQIWLHFAHRLGAVLATAAIVAVVANVYRRHKNQPALMRAANVLLALLVLQITLGIMSVLVRKPWIYGTGDNGHPSAIESRVFIASLHVAVGALVLAQAFLLAARAFRVYRPAAKSPQVYPESNQGMATA